ncbi:hypothetical protein PIB30_053660 [Stylosanthes scabra]|uniref:Uncharacterized protein n=1 Tax=Stylosanthes scabra TaxID=79078 RepID=A0ABU6QJB9_9FABA|nr:hypothetical protein [Stylosanthes scabra]
MEEDPRNPLILGRPFLATSRALIDVENGELILRVHDESLVIQIYKPMHQSPSDSKQCMKMEEGDSVKTAPPDKSSKKKKSKEEKGKSIAFEDTPTASYTPYSAVLVGSDSNASFKDASNHFFDPP